MQQSQSKHPRDDFNEKTQVFEPEPNEEMPVLFVSNYEIERKAMLESLKAEKIQKLEREKKIMEEQLLEFTQLERKRMHEEQERKLENDRILLTRRNQAAIQEATRRRSNEGQSLYNRLLLAGVESKNLIVHQ